MIPTIHPSGDPTPPWHEHQVPNCEAPFMRMVGLSEWKEKNMCSTPKQTAKI